MNVLAFSYVYGRINKLFIQVGNVPPPDSALLLLTGRMNKPLRR